MKNLKKSIFIAISLNSVSASAALPNYEIVSYPVPVSSYGNVTRLVVESENLKGEVTVDIWTPAQYEASADVKYPVLYAYDGQNLFDESYAFAGVPWGIDRACSQLAEDQNFVMPIIVGINNRGAEGLRASDYFPENALNFIPEDQVENTYIFQTCNDIFLGNEEAAFVAEELKPLVDSMFNTSPGMSTTFAIGSSMGALASMYLLCEYPRIFGGAACMSTHWIGSLDLNPDYTMNDDEVCATAILQYLSENLPTDGMHRLYLDQGTAGWDAGYLKYEDVAREIVREKGYTEETDLLFVYDAVGAGHNEWFWQQRISIPLKFLLSKTAIETSGINVIDNAIAGNYDERIVYDLTGKKYLLSGYDILPNGIYIINGKRVIKRN